MKRTERVEKQTLALEVGSRVARRPRQVDRGETSSRGVDRFNDNLGELYGTIINAEAHTLAGAAVKLRRGLLLIDVATPGDCDELKTAKRLMESTLVFLEAHHCRVLTHKAGDEASSQTARPP